MKALQILPALDEGGVERYVVCLNRMLREAGWENVIVSRGGKLVAELTREGARHVVQDMKSKNPLTYPLRALRLRALLKRERPDVVCVHSRVPAWLYLGASRGLGIPWITYAHGANSISRYSRVMTRGTVTMCPSTFVRDWLVRGYGTPRERIRVVPHGIDTVRFDPAKVAPAEVAELRKSWNADTTTKVIMAVGRITRLKGLDMLIRALARLPSEFILVIVGGADRDKLDYLEELKALVRELQLSERVLFAGSQEDIPTYLAAADIVVSANTRKPESFGLSMAEALAMDKPVVAKAFGGALDIVRDGIDGVLVQDDGTVEISRGFAEAIYRCAALKPSGLRQGVAERFSMAKMRDATLAVYNALAT